MASVAPAPLVFVESPPARTSPELFGQLRDHGVEVWIEPDQRLGLRMHEANNFELACQLLSLLGHDVESLDLAYLPVADLEPLMWVRSVESLDLSGTQAELDGLRHLVRLRELSLAATDLDSLAALGRLEALERLDLHEARAPLAGLSLLGDLRELDLSSARTSPRGFTLKEGEGLELASLSDLSGLEVLDLSRTKVRDWAPLARLWTLRELDLGYTNFAELGLLAQFSMLERLNLRRTAVVDLTPLIQLESLTEVDLRDCELVDPASLARLRRSRPRLRIRR